MVKQILIEVLRWSLRFHGIFHLGHIYTDVLVQNWLGVAIGTYVISIEILASFLIPNEHVHLKPIKSEVHDDCCDESHTDQK